MKYLKSFLLLVLALFAPAGTRVDSGHGCGGACPACLPPPPPRTSSKKKEEPK